MSIERSAQSAVRVSDNAASRSRAVPDNFATTQQRNNFQRQLRDKEHQDKDDPSADDRNNSSKLKSDREVAGDRAQTKSGKNGKDNALQIGQKDEKDQRREHESGGGIGQSATALQLASSGVAALSSLTQGVDATMQAQFDRIAAAIAELGATGRQAEYTLQFAGSLPVESAVLSRSATGIVSLLLVTRPGSLSLIDRRIIQRELYEHMQGKKIKLAEIGFSGKAG